jgi:hypothetical protein
VPCEIWYLFLENAALALLSVVFPVGGCTSVRSTFSFAEGTSLRFYFPFYCYIAQESGTLEKHFGK